MTDTLPPRAVTATCQVCETVYDGPDAEIAASRCEQRCDMISD